LRPAGVIAPAKGIIRGTSALVALADENPNKTIIKPDVFQHIAFETHEDDEKAYPGSLMGLRDRVGQSFGFRVVGSKREDEYTIWGTSIYTDDSSLALAAVHAGDYEAGVHWLRRSRQANHSFENTLMWLALAHAGLGQVEEAQPLVNEFLAYRPRFTIARWALGPPYRNQVVARQRTQIAALMLRLGIKQDEAEVTSSRSAQQQ